MRTITRWDEYLIHQTGDPVAVAREGALEVDRFHLLAHDEAGDLLVGTGFGQYRTRGVMDAITYAVLPGEQRIFRTSRRLTPETFADTRVGPLAFEVVEPLRRWRWRLEEPRDGIAFDLEFEGTYDPFLFRTFDFSAERSESNYNHYVQVGRMRGSIELDGERRDVDLVGVRDRSWGVRAERERQGLHFWIQSQLEDAAVCVIYNERRDNSVAYLDGVVMPRDGGPPSAIVELRHAIDFVEGTRVPARYELAIADASGAERTIVYEPLRTGLIGGLGYGGWHGRDRGEYWEASERVATDRPLGELVDEQPIVVLDQVCRIVSGGRVVPGNVQFGITRSASYRYAPTLT